MMLDERAKNMHILFSDIAEEINYIRRIANQKPNKKSTLNQSQKKEQHI